MHAPADASTELVELGDAEALRMFDDHHGRVRHIHADLDHGGAHQDVDAAQAELLHDGLLVGCGKLAVNQTEPKVRENLGAKLQEAFGGSLQVHLFGLLDQRIDDVGLPPLPDLLPQQLMQLRLLLLPAESGADRAPAGRHLGNHRYVEVAVDAHREGPRDRRRRHQEDMRIACLLLEGFPLEHAESMLFVDDGEPQTVEADLPLDDRMSTHDDVDFTAPDAIEHRLPLLLALLSGQEADLQAHGLHRPPDAQEMLEGEDLGRSHEGRLHAVVRGQGHGELCHEGLARPDVPLQEAVHLATAPQVVIDLTDGLLLGSGHLEGQPRMQARGHRARVIETHGGRASSLVAPPEREEELMEKELVPLHPVAGPIELFGRVGEMDLAIGLSDRHEAVGFEQLRGEMLLEGWRQIPERPVYDRPQGTGIDSSLLHRLARRVDGNDHPGPEQLVVSGSVAARPVEPVVIGMLHARPLPEIGHLAVNGNHVASGDAP